MFSTLFIPSAALAQEYGVAESEEMEYAALEIARASAEAATQSLILAVEVADEISQEAIEPAAGTVEGNFNVNWNDTDAIYCITGDDDELEWYDASEALLCLARVS